MGVVARLLLCCTLGGGQDRSGYCSRTSFEESWISDHVTVNIKFKKLATQRTHRESSPQPASAVLLVLWHCTDPTLPNVHSSDLTALLPVLKLKVRRLPPLSYPVAVNNIGGVVLLNLATEATGVGSKQIPVKSTLWQHQQSFPGFPSLMEGREPRTEEG